MWVEYSKSQPTDDKMCLKWAWPRDFKFGVHVDHSKSQTSDDKLSLKVAWSLSLSLIVGK